MSESVVSGLVGSVGVVEGSVGVAGCCERLIVLRWARLALVASAMAVEGVYVMRLWLGISIVSPVLTSILLRGLVGSTLNVPMLDIFTIFSLMRPFSISSAQLRTKRLASAIVMLFRLAKDFASSSNFTFLLIVV